MIMDLVAMTTGSRFMCTRSENVRGRQGKIALDDSVVPVAGRK